MTQRFPVGSRAEVGRGRRCGDPRLGDLRRHWKRSRCVCYATCSRSCLFRHQRVGLFRWPEGLPVGRLLAAGGTRLLKAASHPVYGIGTFIGDQVPGSRRRKGVHESQQGGGRHGYRTKAELSIVKSEDKPQKCTYAQAFRTNDAQRISGLQQNMT